MEPSPERSQDFAHEATQALVGFRDGDAKAGEQLVGLLYGELHAIAGRMISFERSDHTLQATALLHEVWLKLEDQDLSSLSDRQHFVKLASKAMRNLLVDHARGRARLKRGLGWDRVTMVGELVPETESGLDIAALHEALEQLAKQHPRAAEIIELRFFGGCTAEEAASTLGISKRTLEREWRFARAWLFDSLSEQ